MGEEVAAEIGAKIAALRSMFISNDRFESLSDQFGRLLQRRRAEIENDMTVEARGIAVIGSSGSGKTTAIDRMISRHPAIFRPPEDLRYAEIISFQVPSPATLKYVGQTALNALGYPLRRDKPAAIIWDMVRHHLKQRQTLFLHVDEAQDLALSQSDRERAAVVNTLKSLMQNKEWPVGLILSGMPSLGDLLNYDPQLSRRIFPVKFAPISMALDGDEITGILFAYLEKAALEADDDIKSESFADRLIHAGKGEFGLTIEVIIGAIEEALFAGCESVGLKEFAAFFRRRIGCVDGMIPLSLMGTTGWTYSGCSAA